ncbi:MAG: MFS transporter [Pseudomonadota bacterium]
MAGGATRIDWTIWFLAVSQTLTWAGLYYAFPAMLVHWEAGTGWSKTDLTACFTAAIAASALASPYAGRLIDRGFGPYTLAGGALAGGVTMGLLAFADSFVLFFLGWVLIGLMLSACLYDPCFALVTRARGAAARRAITLITLVAGLAGTVAFPMAHGVVEAFGWRAAMIAFSVMVCGIAVPLAFLGGRQLEAEHAEALETRQVTEEVATKRIISRPAFWFLALAFAFMALNHGMIINHLLPLLDERGLDPVAAVFAASMIGPMQVTGRLVMMAVERYVTSHAITIASFAAVSVAALVLLGAGAAPVLLVFYVILQGSGYGVTSIMKPVVARDILGERNFGAITGAIAVFSLTASAAAPYIGSLLWEAGGYDLMLWIACAATASGLLLYLSASTGRFR